MLCATLALTACLSGKEKQLEKDIPALYSGTQCDIRHGYNINLTGPSERYRTIALEGVGRDFMDPAVRYAIAYYYYDHVPPRDAYTAVVVRQQTHGGEDRSEYNVADLRLLDTVMQQDVPRLVRALDAHHIEEVVDRRVSDTIIAQLPAFYQFLDTSVGQIRPELGLIAVRRSQLADSGEPLIYVCVHFDCDKTPGQLQLKMSLRTHRFINIQIARN